MRPLDIAWVLVYLLNLALPLFYGWLVTVQSGRVGMFIAAFLLCVLGYRVCLVSRKFGLALTVGGGVIAALQVFPIFQTLAGLIGLFVAKHLGQVTPDEVVGYANSELGGFIVTTVTGSILMSVALGIGRTIQLLAPSGSWIKGETDG